MKRPSSRVVVVGLDCLEPSLVFDRWRADLPNLSALIGEGTFGPMRSCDPPITVPAWTCMLSGRDPGELGVYGFKNRRSRADAGPSLPGPVTVARVWDHVAAAGGESLLVGVPQTWPPPALPGRVVSGFLAPGTHRPFTHPPELAEAIRARVGDYLLDAEGFRGGDPERVLADIRRMTRQRFGLFAEWLRERPWDFAMLVEIGVDRMHHAFWGQPEIVRAYYREVDALLGEVVEAAGGDAHLLVVSDHGARTLEGGVHLNEWLLAEGHLVLTGAPEAPGPVTPDRIDWGRTRAWGEGGYAGRVHLNVRGREPHGIVAPEDVEDLRRVLADGLTGLVPGTRVLYPERIYRALRGVPPDLLVYFGELAWRALGTVGGGRVLAEANDTGPDEANHALEGVFVLREAGRRGRGRLGGLVLQDVFATVLSLLGLPRPEDTLGTSRAAPAQER